MREIKFRVWEKPFKDGSYEFDGEMHYTEIGNEKRFVSIGFYHDSGWDWNDFIWMQYTGVCDSEGKDIYEGDILTNGEKTGYVEYCNSHECGQYEITVEDNGYSKRCCEKGTSWSNWKIIGNKFENPELMEKK